MATKEIYPIQTASNEKMYVTDSTHLYEVAAGHSCLSGVSVQLSTINLNSIYRYTDYYNVTRTITVSGKTITDSGASYTADALVGWFVYVGNPRLYCDRVVSNTTYTITLESIDLGACNLHADDLGAGYYLTYFPKSEDVENIQAITGWQSSFALTHGSTKYISSLNNNFNTRPTSSTVAGPKKDIMGFDGVNVNFCIPNENKIFNNFTTQTPIDVKGPQLDILVLTGTDEIPLTKENVDSTTLVVKNVGETVTYVVNVDYEVVLAGAVTKIKRKIGGLITDGQSVSARYWFTYSDYYPVGVTRVWVDSGTSYRWICSSNLSGIGYTYATTNPGDNVGKIKQDYDFKVNFIPEDIGSLHASELASVYKECLWVLCGDNKIRKCCVMDVTAVKSSSLCKTFQGRVYAVYSKDV